MGNDATNGPGGGSETFQISDDYADEFYHEVQTLSNSSEPHDSIIDMILRAKLKLSKCSPASTRGIAALLVVLLRRKYAGESNFENLDALHQAFKWNLAVDEENLEVQARAVATLWLKYENYSPERLDEVTTVLSDFVAKIDRLISPFVERPQERNSGRSEELSSKEATHSDPTAILFSCGPNAIESMDMARMCCLYIHEDRYFKAKKYTVTALDDLIAQAEAAVLYFEASKRPGLEDTGGYRKGQLTYAEKLLSRALMARLFRYSSWKTLGSTLQNGSHVGLVPPPASDSPSTSSVMTQPDEVALSSLSIKDIYEKVRLTPGTKQIRLLDLHPGRSEEGTVCTLRVVDLETLPVYEALSYVWGDPKALTPIEVNGTTLHVTANLNAALRRLRHSSTMRCLWADALCINQQDILEKQQQIALMRDIYASATGVAMWLGEPWPRRKEARVECTPKFLSDLSSVFPTHIASVLRPYFVPVPINTVNGEALEQTYSLPSGFRRTLEKLPGELSPNWHHAYAEEMGLEIGDDVPKGMPRVLQGVHAVIEQANATSIFVEFYSFQRWVGSSQGQKLVEFDWEKECSIAKILRSPLDAQQWPVVGAFVILEALASNLHLNELPFFEKDESIKWCEGQPWAKSASMLCNMLTNPYWGRAWILQEILLGEAPVLYYGPHKFPFSRLATAQHHFRLHSQGCCRDLIHDSTLNSSFLKSWWLKINRAFEFISGTCEKWAIASQQRRDRPGCVPSFSSSQLLLSNTGKRKASDPRDLVYSMLGLADDSAEPSRMEADYRLTTAEVFARAMARIIQKTNNLELLAWPVWRAENPFGLPSWAPDWTTDIVSVGHISGVGIYEPVYNASLGLKWNMELHSDLCLSVRSYKVDRIARISERFHCCLEASIDDVQRQLLMWHSLAFTNGDIGENNSLKPSLFSSMAQRHHLGTEHLNIQRKERFLRTLLGDYIHLQVSAEGLSAGRRVETYDVSHIEEWWDWLVAKPTATSRDQHNQNRWKEEGKRFLSIHQSCVANTFHKRFFVTESERFGLGFASETNWGLVAWPTAFHGDEIHVLEGCRFPVLLRPLEALGRKDLQPISKSQGGGKGKAVAKEQDGDSETEIVQVDNHDLRINSVIYSAPLDKCCHSKDKVYQFSGLCYVDGLMDGGALQANEVKRSTIYLR